VNAPLNLVRPKVECGRQDLSRTWLRHSNPDYVSL
jgi:hypothetical protein